MNTDFEKLWKLVSSQFHTREYSVHGPEHWRRVERNALLLATRTGAEIEVVRLFALFHDSRRLNDDWDPKVAPVVWNWSTSGQNSSRAILTMVKPTATL